MFKIQDIVNMPLDVGQVSWSLDGIMTPTEGSMTPPSSVQSPMGRRACLPGEDGIQLPAPFFPPSLVQLDSSYGKACIVPREVPSNLNYPEVPKEKAVEGIAPQDIGTPDDWVPRDTRMIRLTGKHPFNAEAKLRDLYAQGFLTPSNLFFVRNHGAVPKIDQRMADEWKLQIHGLCSRPATFSLEDLRTRFRVVSVPVTLVCAGNRRKEQNVVRKSLGFSWGAAGLSTALFTGVYLADVLDYILPARGAKHVVFEGTDELPHGEPYGTSQLLSWARDRRKGMMLAWGMNGLPLEPDHGFPLRLVVPSQIGGRSVKWLSSIELSEKESQNHLHFRDNKLLPMSVSPDQARREDHWWYDRNYLINELNANSAIACPDHDEILDTSCAAPEETYAVKGYAYAGGGRRVTRVEVSSDDGDTWDLARIQYPEDLFRETAHFDSVYGDLDLTDSDMCFCWCFWSFDMPISTMKTSRAIMVRCMDESLVLQQRDMYVNATGMMNNWWYRVAINELEDGKISFEHPTLAGLQPGGWMQKLKDAGLDPAKPNFSKNSSSPISNTIIEAPKVQEVQMTKPGVDRKISSEELKSPQAKEEAWFVVRGEVYDGSGFFAEHPGGAQSIMIVAGEDATEDFMAIHSSDAKRRLADFHIGTLEGTIGEKEVESEVSGPFLNAKRWKKVKLVSIRDMSHDTKIYRFALDHEEQEMGLPWGQHVYVRLRRKIAKKEGSQVAEGEIVQRAYTPLSGRGAKGYIDMLIKIYYPTPAYPLGGRMTVGFAELVVGDSVEMKGPVGHFTWKGQGIASINGKEKRFREVGLICGGSGITPVLQVLRAVLTDPMDMETRVWLVDVNRNFEDILCREELERFAAEYPGRFSLHFSLTGEPVVENWVYSRGRPSKQMLEDHLPAAGDDSLVCICGPGPMELSVKGFLAELGWNTSNQIVLF